MQQILLMAGGDYAVTSLDSPTSLMRPSMHPNIGHTLGLKEQHQDKING
jgi:hypothetical protein